MGGNRKSAALIAAMVIQALPCVMTHAQVSGTWIGPNDRNGFGLWIDPTVWNSNPLVPGDGGVAVFTQATAGVVNVILDSPVTLSRLEYRGNTTYRVMGGTLIFNGPAIVDVTSTSVSVPWLFSFDIIPFPFMESSNGFIKTGNGVAVLPSSSHLTGGITVNGGTLLAGGNQPLYASHGTLTLNGGALRVNGNLYNLDTPATNPITVGANGGTIVTDTTPVVVDFASNISGSSTLVLGRSSTSTVKLRSPQSFTGWLHVNTDVDLLNNGAMPNASGFVVTDRILLDAAATANFNRIADSAEVYLRGGAIEGIGLAGSSGTEQIGPVTLERGISSINSNASLNLDFQSITRTEHSVLNVGSGAFVARINGTLPELSGDGAAGTPEVGIIPWARGANSSITPLTVEAGTIRALSPAEFITSIPIGDTSPNLKLTASATLASNATVNSLTIAAGIASLSFTGSGSLGIASGALFLQGSMGNTTTTIDVPLQFGTREAILHASSTASSGTVAITGPISGSGGLTLAGTIQLAGQSTYTGTTTVNGRLILTNSVIAGTPGALGSSATPVIVNSNNGASQTPVVNGITFYPPTGGTLVFTRDLIVRAEHLALYNSLNVASLSSGAGSVEVGGNIQLEGALSLAGAAGADPRAFVVSGRISGPGRLTNLSNVTLTGDNDFTGGVVIGNGTIFVGSDTALGTGTIYFTLDTNNSVVPTKAITLKNPVILSQIMRIGGSQPITFAGPVDVNFLTAIISTNNTQPTTFTHGKFDGELRKFGSGVLQIPEIPVAGLEVTGGTLRILPKTEESGLNVSLRVSIATTGSSLLDLTNNDLIIDHASNSINGFNSVQQMLRDKRITTSMSENGHALGYADNAVMGLTSFLGEAVDPTTVLIRYTYAGDANLDGLVDAADLAALASHWQKTSQTWIGGDFNYDAKVDLSDLYLLATNWQRGAGANADLASSLNLFGLDPSAVPEPTFPLSVGAFSILGALLRRRNSHQA